MVHSEFSFTYSGNTPSKALQIMLHCELVAPQRAASLGDPFSLLKWNDAQMVRRSIGAHQTITVSNESYDFKNPDVLLNAQMHIVPVFLTGEVKYEDWIEPLHRTQFAHQLAVHETGKMPGFDGMSVETEPVGAHNCTDEDCPVPASRSVQTQQRPGPSVGPADRATRAFYAAYRPLSNFLRTSSRPSRPVGVMMATMWCRDRIACACISAAFNVVNRGVVNSGPSSLPSR